MIEKLNPAYKTYQMYIPPGGHVEFSEKLEEACIREVAEETGLIVSGLELKGVVTFLRAEYHSVCFFFIAHNVNGELASNEPDKQTSHWIDLDGIEHNNKVPRYHASTGRSSRMENQRTGSYIRHKLAITHKLVKVTGTIAACQLLAFL